MKSLSIFTFLISHTHAIINTGVLNTTIPNNFTKANIGIPSIDYNQDLGPCICDLTFNSCDIDCCCDSECTVQEQSLFDKCSIESFAPGPISSCTDFFRTNRVDGPFRNSDGALCVVRVNSPIQGYFYAAPTLILNNAEFNDKLKNLVFSYVDESSLLDNVYSVDGYKNGDSIVIQYPDLNVYSNLMLPTPTFSDFCNDENSAKFLVSESNTCQRKIINAVTACATNSFLDRNYYLGNFNVLSGVNGTVVVIPAQVNPPAGIAYNNGTNICSNYVTGVSYVITINPVTNLITQATIGLTYNNTAIIAGDTITQTFSITFMEQGTNPSSISYPKSGNPGYIQGKPILSGKAVTQNTTSVIQYTPDPQFGYTLATNVLNNGAFICPDPTDLGSRTVVGFGEDVITGCNLMYSFDDLRDNCAQIRKDVYAIQAQQINQLTHVGMFGNSDVDNINQWIKVLNNTPSALTGVGVNLKDGNINGVCSDLLTTLNIQFITTNLGLKQNPQSSIIGVSVSATSGSFSYRCKKPTDCTSKSVKQQFSLSSTVEFISDQQTLSMFVPPAPNSIPTLPDDVFYPFKLIQF